MNPSIKMNNHPHANIRNSKSIPHRLYVCNIELNVLVQLDGRLHATLLNVRHEMRPLVRHVHLATAQASIVGFQPTPAREQTIQYSIQLCTPRLRNSRAVNPHLGISPQRSLVAQHAHLPARIKPHLDEAEGLGRVEVVLRVRDSGARRHELHRPRPQRLLCAHGVLVRQLTLDDVCHNLGVAVAVLTKSPLRLHQVVVHHAHRPEPRPVAQKSEGRRGAI